MRSDRLGFLLLFVLILAHVPAIAAPPDSIPFRVPEGWEVKVFADVPQLGNPVAFCFDERGRIFVAEEYRFNRGTEENRTRPFLLEDDLQLQTVDDRLAMYRKFAERFEGGMGWFSRYADQVRMLEDANGDGRADRSTVFAGNFNAPLDGLAAGVIARDGDVYLTCIPNLWRLRDTNGDGVADVREAVLHGFGVNAGFLGHDLHGLVWGPDGKLYFSVGDRGFHVVTREGKTLHGPRAGAVFRCDPDGSHLEVIARGLRNPQELAFDARGNLFAVDNNCDKGDDARLVYVIEGGESGWNMSYQSLPSPYLTGPWHAEKLWHLPHPGQAAWIVPPVGKLGAGPSGFAYYPGVGMPERYRDHFFYCNFTTDGGVESFAVRPQGAGFTKVDDHKVITPVRATDVDFGYDCALYFSEFGNLEWDGSNNAGRIIRVTPPEARENPTARQVAALFKDGFQQRSVDELIGLLGHADMRVRLRAQFALAERGESVIDPLSSALTTLPSGSVLARLHCLWGLGQVARKTPRALATIETHLKDTDATIRAQASKILGDLDHKPSGDRIQALLRDESPAVRLQAAIALGKLGQKTALDPLLALARENNDTDPYLRHAIVMGVLGVGATEAILPFSRDASPAVRRIVALVLRRRADPRIARFLDDADPTIATEAARAINDLPIDAATGELAKSLARIDAFKSESLDPWVRRALNAHLRLGGTENARALRNYLADGSHPLAMREEALAALENWDTAPNRDRVTGFWRPVAKHDPKARKDALDESVDALLAATTGPLQARTIDLLMGAGATIDGKMLVSLVADTKKEAPTRLAALRYLAARDDSRLESAVRSAILSNQPTLRAEARVIVARHAPEIAYTLLAPLVNKSTVTLFERQQALAALGTLKSPKADDFLIDLLDKLRDDQVPGVIQLDLIEAAAARSAPKVREALARYHASRPAADPLAKFRPSLEGGDRARGAVLFTDHPRAQCVRCHKIAGQGGVTGPDLSQVATRADRLELLQSMIVPDAKIAPGYATVSLALTDGRVVAGILRAEDRDTLIVETPGGRRESIARALVEDRTPAHSAMPGVADVLSPRDLRDLIEYLYSLK